MHPAALPPDIVERVIARRGRLHPFDRISPTHAAFVVIDMQNAFCAPAAAIEVPVARSIVATSTGSPMRSDRAEDWSSGCR
ncbi:MAG TPA: hypothetical protein VN823_28310 [Stellaceae bacterium]|nr:hypothetical protein [Stellaceae bacterium]